MSSATDRQNQIEQHNATIAAAERMVNYYERKGFDDVAAHHRERLEALREEASSEGGDVEALSDDSLAEARQASERLRYWKGRNEAIADAEREALCAKFDADSVDDIPLEVV